MKIILVSTDSLLNIIEKINLELRNRIEDISVKSKLQEQNRAIQGIKARISEYRIEDKIAQITNVKPKDHLSLEYTSYSELTEVVLKYITTAARYDYSVAFLMTKRELGEIEDLMKAQHIELSSLMEENKVIVITTEEINSGSELVFEFDLIRQHIDSVIDFIKSEGKKGIAIIATVSSNLAKREYIENAIRLEREFGDYVYKKDFPMILLCPYKKLSNSLKIQLEQYHNF